jgi:phage-related holin
MLSPNSVVLGKKNASVVVYEAFGIFPVSLLVFMCSDLQSTLGGAWTMHRLSNAKKILKVGCRKSTVIVPIVPLAAFFD